MQMSSPRFAMPLMVVLVASALYSQSFNGTVSGTVTDPTGGVLPNAKITLVNENTNEDRSQNTGAAGTYTLPQVPPGVCRLEAELQGFKKFVRPHVSVDVQQQALVDIRMEVGSVAESVEVTGAVTLLQARHIQNWILAGNSDWGLTLVTGEQFVRLNDGMFRGEILQGARYTSVKVVRGDAVGSMDYPPKGTYTFHNSISSGRGDWRANKSYRAGMNLNNALIPISVVDDISEKSLPASQSFFSTAEAGSLVLSAIKKADNGNGIVLRVFENEGASATTPVSFLGKTRGFEELNLLEEAAGRGEQQRIAIKPYEIRTLLLRLDR